IGDKLTIIFRNFPLSEIHPRAIHAAYAAEAAAKQGKFWEMYHLLFENQESLEDQDLLSYAKDLNLDMQKFKKDMGSEKVAKKVKNK
ncbi:MAG: thioredoxin domain-containing protein, partial [Bacteroidota bacterium]